MIRPYESHDLDALLEVWTDASKVGHPFLDDAFMAAERQNIINLYVPNAETWVWETEGRVVGFVSLMDNEIGGLFVTPAMQGRGIGRALVDHARGLCKNLEVEVFKKNAVDRAFYSAYGFVVRHEGIHLPTRLAILRLRLP